MTNVTFGLHQPSYSYCLTICTSYIANPRPYFVHVGQYMYMQSFQCFFITFLFEVLYHETGMFLAIPSLSCSGIGTAHVWYLCIALQSALKSSTQTEGLLLKVCCYYTMKAVWSIHISGNTPALPLVRFRVWVGLKASSKGEVGGCIPRSPKWFGIWWWTVLLVWQRDPWVHQPCCFCFVLFFAAHIKSLWAQIKLIMIKRHGELGIRYFITKLWPSAFEHLFLHNVESVCSTWSLNQAS